MSGFGDLTVVPVMLAWKSDDWQYDFLMPVYAPTGSYQIGRLGNTGLNYWTFDPIVGAAYSNAKSGFNAAAHLGYAINTENNATQYKSGNYLHLDTAVQQIFPLGSGCANIGAEAWYFEQVTCDSGAGATLGCFKGRTAGIGPVLGYIQPIGNEKLLFEFKWLPELDTQEPPEGRLRVAEDGLHVLTTRFIEETAFMPHKAKSSLCAALLAMAFATAHLGPGNPAVPAHALGLEGGPDDRVTRPTRSASSPGAWPTARRTS